MREARLAPLTGKAGEYAVAAQLLIRGIVPSWPSVDMGHDLVAGKCRIQVKCAHLYVGGRRNAPVYFFPLSKTKRMKAQGETFKDVCDVVVFWGIEQNRFWVVPSSLCDQCVGVELGVDSSLRPRFVGSIKDMREMLALGYSRGKVAKHYGIQRTSLQQFLDSGKDYADESVASQMRACENRWELIADFTCPAVEVPEQEKKENSQ